MAGRRAAARVRLRKALKALLRATGCAVAVSRRRDRGADNRTSRRSGPYRRLASEGVRRLGLRLRAAVRFAETGDTIPLHAIVSRVDHRRSQEGIHAFMPILSNQASHRDQSYSAVSLTLDLNDCTKDSPSLRSVAIYLSP